MEHLNDFFKLLVFPAKLAHFTAILIDQYEIQNCKSWAP